ncbi:MAG: ribonuclease P [Candidatus Aenigmarchaeota archaeon]|nr:ribonuclease P [Candidatus Aenigmarchaeota archaeon]
MESRRRSTKPPEELKIAKERITILFGEAEKMVRNDKKLANRYVELARKIGMRYNISIPSYLRKLVCRKCKEYMYPGITAKISTKKGYLRKECLQCGKVTKIRIKKK